MLAPEQLLLLVAIGLFAGTIGTFVGLGGGFVNVPVLLLLFNLDQTTVVATSLFVIMCNSITGTFLSARQRRIDWKAALIASAGSVPAVIAGTKVVGWLDRDAFQLIIAIVLLLSAIMLVLRGRILKESGGYVGGEPRERKLANGEVHRYRINAPVLGIFGVVKGFFAGLTGIAGGSLLGPFIILVMGVPITVATAVSQCSIVFTSTSGTLSNLVGGRIAFEYAVPMAVGVFFGAMIGSRFAGRVGADTVKWALAIVLLAVALKLIL